MNVLPLAGVVEGTGEVLLISGVVCPGVTVSVDCAEDIGPNVDDGLTGLVDFGDSDVTILV